VRCNVDFENPVSIFVKIELPAPPSSLNLLLHIPSPPFILANLDTYSMDKRVNQIVLNKLLVFVAVSVLLVLESG